MNRVPATSQPSLRKRFVLSVLAREVLGDVARLLAAHGIGVMPLKGVLFQQLLYADPAQRMLTDVDVLVPEADFWRAIAALRNASFELHRARRPLIEVALRSPRGLVVDVHRQLFSPARYRLSTESVFRRATRDDELIGVPLQIADPRDTAAHLIGKFVSDHVVEERFSRLQELLLRVRHCHIEPAALARHLALCGLARAARYTLGCGAEHFSDPFFAAALAALPPDAVGRACARAARSLIPRWQGTLLASAPAHLLNASLPRAAASVAWLSLNRWRPVRGLPP